MIKNYLQCSSISKCGSFSQPALLFINISTESRYPLQDGSVRTSRRASRRLFFLNNFIYITCYKIHYFSDNILNKATCISDSVCLYTTITVCSVYCSLHNQHRILFGCEVVNEGYAHAIQFTVSRNTFIFLYFRFCRKHFEITTILFKIAKRILGMYTL